MFESYNKVQVPFSAKLEFLIASTREEFLQSVETAVASLSLVTVVTPEISYPSANLVHYGYRRESRSGVSLIRVSVWCQEIRIAQSTTTTDSAAVNQLPGNANTTPVPSGGGNGSSGGSGSDSGAPSGENVINIGPADFQSNNAPSALNNGQVQTVPAVTAATPPV